MFHCQRAADGADPSVELLKVWRCLSPKNSWGYQMCFQGRFAQDCRGRDASGRFATCMHTARAMVIRERPARNGFMVQTCKSHPSCRRRRLQVMNLLVGVLVEVVRVVATAEQEGRVVRNLPLGWTLV